MSFKCMDWTAVQCLHARTVKKHWVMQKYTENAEQIRNNLFLRCCYWIWQLTQKNGFTNNFNSSFCPCFINEVQFVLYDRSVCGTVCRNLWNLFAITVIMWYWWSSSCGPYESKTLILYLIALIFIWENKCFPQTRTTLYGCPKEEIKTLRS